MPIIAFALMICAATYLVIRDAKSRKMNSTAWGFFVAFTACLGLPVYLIARRDQRQKI